MKNLKKYMLYALSLVLVAALAVTGTVAYLSDTDSDLNTMVMGNVTIDQIETDNDGNEFEQGQPLYPDSTVEKNVTVENTGKSDAYVRTVFAFEKGSVSTAKFNELVQISAENPLNYVCDITIDGAVYAMYESVYTEALKPGETTAASLKEVYLSADATNEDCEALDADGNGRYDILVVSQAVQSENFTGGAEAALDTAFYNLDKDNHPWTEGVEEVILVTTAAELQEALKTSTDAKSGNKTVYIAEDLDLSETAWTPIKVDGYHGAGVVTLKGQGNTITGLSAPLFAGGFAGESGIVIEDLTIADSEIVSTSTQGAGAFIECVDSMETIVLDNCHLLNSSVDAPNARTGGLVGWTSGYSNVNDGPVKTYVTITNCSVVGNTITGTAVGGINGHAGASDWTYTTIENCTVVNNKLISTDDGEWRVGSVVGTANVGEVTIRNMTTGGNTMTQENASSQRKEGLSDMVGRFVGGSTGKLFIEGTNTEAKMVTNNEELKAAATTKNAVVYLEAGTYTDLPAIAEGVTLVGEEGVVFNDTLAGTLKNVTMKNIEIEAGNAQRWGYSAGDVVFEDCTFTATSVYAIHYDGLSGTVTYKNCDITGWAAIGHGADLVTFDGCTIKGNGTYGVIRMYSPAVIKNCTFDVKDVNTSDVYQDGIHAVDTNIDVIDCTNVNGAMEDIFNVSGTGTITQK